MSLSRRKRILDGTVTEFAAVAGMKGALHGLPFDPLGKNFPFTWVHAVGEQLTSVAGSADEEHLTLRVQTETIYESNDSDVLADGEALYALILQQLGVTMTTFPPASWRPLRQACDSFHPSEMVGPVETVLDREGVRLVYGLILVVWDATYVRNMQDPFE